MKEQLLSVGIDIGTSTTQLVFSKLTVKNIASAFNMPEIAITEKEVVYKSDIYFTPLIDNYRIDCDGIKKIITQEYANAGINKDEIDTGAVIITGETSRKENAQEVLQILSGFSGDFVVATAGPDLESIISGKGAGASEYSQKYRKMILNIDVGGGTSNYALFRNGEIVDTGCLNVGGRLLKVDEKGRLNYVSPVLSDVYKDLSVGEYLSSEKAEKITAYMVEALMQGANIFPRDEKFSQFVTNKGIDEKWQN